MGSASGRSAALWSHHTTGWRSNGSGTVSGGHLSNQQIRDCHAGPGQSGSSATARRSLLLDDGRSTAFSAPEDKSRVSSTGATVLLLRIRLFEGKAVVPVGKRCAE